ncbi:MAG TPA: hydrogenase maturation protease [Terriglobales bacterium]|nr:hydrogenase maturation protease [Terriglobales bacterium]
MADVLVIGYGNPLRGDDGVGPVIAEEIAKKICDPQSKVQVVACHQLNPELAEAVADTREVIFVDASVELKPGDVRISSVKPDQFSPAGFTHSMKPSALLATASELFGQAPPAKAVAIGAASFDIGMTLTPEVRAAVRLATEVIEKEIARCLRSNA